MGLGCVTIFASNSLAFARRLGLSGAAFGPVDGGMTTR
jgi:hypothetical protein